MKPLPSLATTPFSTISSPPSTSAKKAPRFSGMEIDGAQIVVHSPDIFDRIGKDRNTVLNRPGAFRLSNNSQSLWGSVMTLKDHTEISAWVNKIEKAINNYDLSGIKHGLIKLFEHLRNDPPNNEPLPDDLNLDRWLDQLYATKSPDLAPPENPTPGWFNNIFRPERRVTLNLQPTTGTTVAFAGKKLDDTVAQGRAFALEPIPLTLSHSNVITGLDLLSFIAQTGDRGSLFRSAKPVSLEQITRHFQPVSLAQTTPSIDPETIADLLGAANPIYEALSQLQRLGLLTTVSSPVSMTGSVLIMPVITDTAWTLTRAGQNLLDGSR